MQKRPSISTIDRGQRPVVTSLNASFGVSAMRVLCESSPLGEAVLPVSELVTLGEPCASALSLRGPPALHAASAATLAQPAATSMTVSRNVDVTVPSEAACMPLQVLGDKYSG